MRSKTTELKYQNKAEVLANELQISERKGNVGRVGCCVVHICRNIIDINEHLIDYISETTNHNGKWNGDCSFIKLTKVDLVFIMLSQSTFYAAHNFSGAPEFFLCSTRTSTTRNSIDFIPERIVDLSCSTPNYPILLQIVGN